MKGGKQYSLSTEKGMKESKNLDATPDSTS